MLLLIFPISLLSCSSKVKEISFESFNETYSSFEYDNYHKIYEVNKVNKRNTLETIYVGKVVSFGQLLTNYEQFLEITYYDNSLSLDRLEKIENILSSNNVFIFNILPSTAFDFHVIFKPFIAKYTSSPTLIGMNVAGAKYNKKSKELTLYVDAYYYAKYGYSTTEPIHTFVGDNAVILSKDKKVEKINFLTHYEIISYANKYDLKRPEYEDISRKDDLEIVYSNLKEAYQ